MHKNVEIKVKWENVANEKQESKLEDGAGGIDGVGVVKEVSHVLCKLFSKLFKQRLRKPKT